MTAILSASDALRKENIMASPDDHQLNYSSNASTDWKSKYYEVADMLTETRHELDEFQQSSKELEEELERDLQRTEKAQQDLRVKVERAENERDDWKAKFVQLQTTHNMATARLQRELDTLRQDHQKLKVQLRELEMGNDDLERNERAVTSSLADVEAKYNRALEEKIILEHELLDKANLEEECQRLKDDLRDTNEEVSVLRDQLDTALTRAAAGSNPTLESLESATPSSSMPSLRQNSEEDLLHTRPPSDLQLSDLALDSDSMPSSVTETPRPSTSSLNSSEAGKSALLQRAGFGTPRTTRLPAPGTTSTPINRSTTLPSLTSPSRLPARNTPARLPTRIPGTPYSSIPTTGIPQTVARSKGVQMVSEMRAKVKNLEAKIHTRVPRIRNGSTSTRPYGSPSASTATVKPPPGIATSSSSNSFLNHIRKSSEDIRKPNFLSRRSDEEVDRKQHTPAGKNGEGWVLVLDDTPSPIKDRAKESSRQSSTSPTPRYRPYASKRNGSGSSVPEASDSKDSLSRSSKSARRPQSRTSTSTEGRSSVSTTATMSSIATPSSRPTSPTFLPVASSGLFSHQSGKDPLKLSTGSGTSTGNGTLLKRSTGPGHQLRLSTGPTGLKRSSLGASKIGSPSVVHHSSDRGMPPPPPPRERPTSVPAPARTSTDSGSTSPSSFKDPLVKSPPVSHSASTTRISRLPSSTTTPALGRSRIGRPSFTGAGRKSFGGGDSDNEDSKIRIRPGSLSKSTRRG